MAVDKPKSTQLADDVVERLRGVLKGQGYQTDLGRKAGVYVGRRVLVLSQMQEGEFPAAAVLMGRAQPDDEMQTGAYREVASIGVLLYAKAKDIPAELERLDADCRSAVLKLPVLAQAYGRAKWIETVPYYNELEMTDRGVVMVTFAQPVSWTPDEI